jgi:hypothetical protein
MKRLLAGLGVLVMLGMCASSFGYILVYNVSTTVKGADYDTDAKVSIPLKGYLVLNLDDSDGDLIDANLIMYGNDANTPKKQKVYVQLNYSDSADDLGADVWYVADYMFVDFWGRSPWDFEIMLQGKAKWRDIGAADTQWVASSIKGVNLVWDGFLLGPGDQEVSGTANASATLWTAAVKAINDPLETWTQDEVVVTGKDIGSGHENSLIERLVAQHYQAAELP